MVRDLPPLSALRVFEAAARHLSFTRAAAELGMTQAAVSYQVRLLEDRVGSSLFLRGGRRVALTAAGATLSRSASEGLDLLASGYAAVRGSVAGTLTLMVMPSFAASWLARHLGEFQTAHPDLVIRVIGPTETADVGREEIDVTVRMGVGSGPGLSSHPLFDVCFTPMLSSKLLERIGGLATPADLAHAPLLDPADPWWDTWFQSAGVARPAAPPRSSSSFGAQYLEAVAAMAGHGVALLTPFFWHSELANGQLVQPFDLICRDERPLCLCYPTSRRNLPKVRLFRDWLLGHFPHEASGADGPDGCTSRSDQTGTRIISPRGARAKPQSASRSGRTDGA